MKSSDQAVPPAAYSVPLGNLRAFVTVLVVIHHSLIAYHQAAPPPPHKFLDGVMAWRAFPVSDPQHWVLAAPIVGFNDTFFMSLMFLLSGLFVTASVQRKGTAAFLRGRVLRLGIPFLFAALLIAPAAYYFSWLQAGGTPDLIAFWHAWHAIGYWPTGPAWFVLLLLIFDVAAAALFFVLPSWSARLGRLAARAREQPARFFWIVSALSLVAFGAMALRFGMGGWTYWGFFQFETARIFHYFLYFLLGAGIGAAGLQSGLVAPDGRLAARWWAWTLAMVVAFILGIIVFIGLITSKGAAQQVWMLTAIVSFVLNCAVCCFAFLALFTRFVKRPNRVMDSLTRNAYGIYLIHYAIVAALQYALLNHPLGGGTKAVIVIVGALALSWTATAILRHIPVLSRLVGE